MLTKEDLMNSSIDTLYRYDKYLNNLLYKVNHAHDNHAYQSAIDEFNEKIKEHLNMVKRIINYKIIIDDTKFLIPQCNNFYI